MNENQIDNVDQVVRGTQFGGSMSELVFNNTTGEFEQRPKGTSGGGEVVTEMTEGGFANE